MADTKENAKNQSSRQVPIHPNIRPLVEELAEGSTDDHLICDTRHPHRAEQPGPHIGNRFGDIKRKLFRDAAKNKLTFHGLRAAFITALEEAGIPEPKTKLIVGHARQSLSLRALL